MIRSRVPMLSTLAAALTIAGLTVAAVTAAGSLGALGAPRAGGPAPLPIASAQSASGSATRYDTIISGGRIVDGAGNPWYRADVGIIGDRIRAIGDLSHAEAARRIDASGLAVSPGFIDIHTHSINGLERLPTADNVLFEGVTTAIDGNDGSSPLPIGAALDRLIAQPVSINLGFFAGHGSVRRQVMALADRTPTADEQTRMNEVVAQAMRDGAMGLSTGLAYVPGAYAKTDEVTALSKVVAVAGGIYTSHMRDEGRGTRDSVRETIRIGEGAGIPVQISHIKVAGRGQFGDSAAVLDLIGAARARGLDVTFDQYPYAASSTGLSLIFPRWALADDKLKEHLADPGQRAKVVAGMVTFLEEYMGDDPSVIQLSRCRFDASLDGKRLSELLKAANQPLTREATAELIIDLEQKGGCSAIYHWMDEGDVERFMRSPFGMIASDGGVVAPGVGSPHPRSYGTFPRVLGRYVREKSVLTLEDAVRRMTSYPAQRLSLRDRGLIREGYAADVIVFDAAAITDRATFTDAHQHAIGVRYVLVNGTMTIDDGKHTGAKAGRPVYGPGRRESTVTR